MSIAERTAEHWDVDAEAYHADPAISHSKLDVFIEDPALYEGRFITREFPEERTAALDFGTVVHDLVLGVPFKIGPDNFNYRTVATFRPCDPPTGKPDFVSKSGSEYYYRDDRVIRVSDHWGEVGGCYWAQRGGDVCRKTSAECRWVHFVYNRRSFVPIPRDVLAVNGAKSGKAWKEYEADHASSILLKEKEFEPIAFMLASIKEHPKARAILDYQGHEEFSIRWTDKETGLRLRSRLDKLTPHFICDLKTARSSNKRKFEMQCYADGYHRQAAMYQDAVEALTGDILAFVFIVVKKDAPYSVETYVPDESFIELGRQENREALRDLVTCMETGVWKRQGWGTLVPISGPRWAFNK